MKGKTPPKRKLYTSEFSQTFKNKNTNSTQILHPKIYSITNPFYEKIQRKDTR